MQTSLRVLKTRSKATCVFIAILMIYSCGSDEQRDQSIHKELIAVDSVSDKIEKVSILTPGRHKLTRSYVKQHYGLSDPYMVPKGIVIHFTALPDLRSSLDVFRPDTISSKRKYVKKYGQLNVGAHYLIDTNGGIYQMLPDTFIGRHTIGFNSSCIGIENVGLDENQLTTKQLEANCYLVLELKKKYSTINYLFGHHEYMFQDLAHFDLYLELDSTYGPTDKVDPGSEFMTSLRSCLKAKEIQLKQ